MAYLRRSPSLFHTATALSGSLRSPPSPRGEGFMSGTATLSYTMLLKRSPTLFHTASTLSGSLRSPPSPRGEGFVRRHWFSPRILYSLWLYRIMAAVLPFCANKNRSARTGFTERFRFYYSTVTDFARFLGLSTSFPLLIEV